MSEKAQIIFDGKTYELPVITGSEGEKAIDIGKLREQSGLITLDYGYKNTGATTSSITFLDGELGVLRECNAHVWSPVPLLESRLAQGLLQRADLQRDVAALVGPAVAGTLVRMEPAHDFTLSGSGR